MDTWTVLHKKQVCLFNGANYTDYKCVCDVTTVPPVLNRTIYSFNGPSIHLVISVLHNLCS